MKDTTIKIYLNKITFGLVFLITAFLSINTLSAQTVPFRIESKTVNELDTFTVAISTVQDLTGKDIFSFKFRLNYSSYYLEYLGIESVGTVLNTWGEPTVNNQIADNIIIAGAGAAPLSGSGELFLLKFAAKAPYSYGTSISYTANESYLNEGSPAMTISSGTITINALPKPVISPSGGLLYIGETLNIYASGGTPPYTYHSQNPTVASISSSGVVTALTAGTSKMYIEDAKGLQAQMSGVVEVRGVKLKVIPVSTTIQENFYLPIEITTASNTPVYSGSFELSYPAGGLAGIVSDVQQGDFPISIQTNVVNNRTFVSFASATPINGTGILCRVGLKAIGSGTFTVQFNNALFNENLLSFDTSGSVTSICQPTVAPTNLLPENSRTNVASTIDLFWQAAINAKSYQLFLWKDGENVPTSPSNYSISNTTIRLYNLDPGVTYFWKIASVNECSNEESETQSFTVIGRPDLIVESITAPTNVLSGADFTISYSIKNTGQIGTGTAQWQDAVYISKSPNFNDSKTLLKRLYNVKQLAENESYSQSFTVKMPNEYDGNYYIHIRADDYANVVEISEDNNTATAENAISVSMKPFPDITVKEIQAVGSNLIPGDSISIQWKVENIGNAETVGGWSEKITIIAANGQQVRLNPSPTSNLNLAAGNSVTRTAKLYIPKILRFSGSATIEVELIPSATLVEHSSGKANNTGVSAGTVTAVDQLFLEINTTSLSEGSTLPAQGVITRSGDYASPLTVTISHSISGQINTPASITIPTNVSSANFEIHAVNNTVVDGNRDVTIEITANQYQAANRKIQILDDEATTLTASLDKNTANEGDELLLTITRNLITNQPVTVYISTNKPNQWTFVNAATIPANEASVTMPIHVTQDNITEINENATLTISSGGFQVGTVTAFIIDDDMPVLEFTISNDTISEGAGIYAAQGKIKRISGVGEIKINLSASVSNALILPQSITIPKNVNEVQFNIGVIDNNQVDGYRDVKIQGAIYINSCGCNSTSENGGVISQNIVIADNDGASLTISAEPFTLFEGRQNAGKLIITRNTETTNSLSVTISHNDPTEVEIQTTATIPAGQKSIEVPIHTIDDGIQDGNQTVNISVQTEGFISGFCTVYVTDLNNPDFVVRNVQLNKAAAATNDVIQISGNLVNIGYLNAPVGSKIEFYLSKDDFVDKNSLLLGSYTTTKSILMGDSIEFTDRPVKLPSTTGIYKLIVKANPNNEIKELVYTNNTSVPIPISIQPEYSATANVDLTQFLPNTSITIYGSAKKIDSQPAINANVDVYLISNGTRRELKAVTDASGNYSIQFTPLKNESGHFEVGASYPGEKSKTVQDSFDILGLKRTKNDYITWLTKKTQPLNLKLEVQNTSNIPLKNVRLSVDEFPEGFSISAAPIVSIPGNTTVEINYTIVGTEVSKAKDYIPLKLKITSDEGINLEFPAYYYCQELQSALATFPPNINTTVSKGTTKYYEFTLGNNGAGETGKVAVSLPKVDFISLVGPDTISNILPGETKVITLRFTDSDLQLNVPVSGSIAINPTYGSGITVPYKLEAVSEATGSIRIDVLDEYTYNTVEAPHVKDAHVVIRHPFSGVIVAEGVTGANGIFEAHNIPEGYYKMTVNADKHESYQANINIDAGKTLNQSVFISFQAISYTWDVVRTEIEDEYKIDLIMTFETNVPVPVVVIEAPKDLPNLINDETFPFLMTLTNKGLITANDVTLALPTDDPEYEFVTNFTTMSLLAQQAIQVPVVMKRRGIPPLNPVPGMQRAPNASGSCAASYQLSFSYECGPYVNGGFTSGVFNFDRSCGGGGGTVIPGGGGGGSGPGSPPVWGGGGTGGHGTSSSTVTLRETQNNCVDCITDLALAGGGCIPGPVGYAATGASCVKSFVKDGITFVGTVKCGIGFIPVIGCVFSVTDAMLNCLGPLPFSVSSAAPMMKIIAEDSRYHKSPILQQAQMDVYYSLYSINAERSWADEITGIEKMYERINFVDFAEAIDPFTTQLKSISPLEIIEINQKLYGTDILPTEVEAFALRWNSTMNAYSQGVYSPTAMHPDIIDDALIEEYVSRTDSAYNYAIERGYNDVADMIYLAMNTIREETGKEQSSVCAAITIQISQKLVMTREAFEGTLTISNGNTTTDMTNIKLDLEIKNSQGIICNDLFQINTKALSILTGIDGTGSLGAGKKGSATILFIPTKNAAPEVPESYSFGGSFSYIDPFTGLEVTKRLFPVTLDVNPSPDLYLHYFMQRDILGDDPLTEKVEPVVPAELALMIHNTGFGTAGKVRVESAQPEIIDNEKGLSIHLALIGSNLNGQPRQLGLNNIDFGDIAPKSTAIGQWWFTSSLLGHFVDYETRVVHTNSFGNPELSLISGAKLHELIRSIRIYNPDDGINDFLVNEIQDSEETPDRIYTSKGDVIPVEKANQVITSGQFRAPDYELELHVSPKLYGWNYGKVKDPTGGNYRIVSATRLSDNFVIPIENIWQTHVTMLDGGDPVYENKIHMVDDFSAVELTKYKLKFEPLFVDPPKVVRIENVPTSLISTRLTSVRVVFEKPIDPATFTHEDLILRVQGGENIIDNTVLVTEIDPKIFNVDFANTTIADGYYVLNVNTDGISSLSGEYGMEGKQVSWTQFANTPAVLEFIGMPDSATSTKFDELILEFTVPIDAETFTKQQLSLTRDGQTVNLTGVSISLLDTEDTLFQLSGLSDLMLQDGVYQLSIDLTQITSKTGVYGITEQSVSWGIDTQAPTIQSITLQNSGGMDAQHVTSIEVKFSEAVNELQLSALELWKGTEQQPISQLNINRINDSIYQITDFRMLTYYEGNYTLKINMDNMADGAGNNATGIIEKSWIVDRTLPAAVSNLRITPDLGYSSTDGITSVENITASMTVNAPNSRITLYQNSFGVSTFLTEKIGAGIGELILPIQIRTFGTSKLQAVCEDEFGNQVTTEIPIYIDNMPLSASSNFAPIGVLNRHPVLFEINFSDKLLDENAIKTALNGTFNNLPVNTDNLKITKVSDTKFQISDLHKTFTAQGGAYAVHVDLNQLNKYETGKSGNTFMQVSWSLSANSAPVADAGIDINASQGDLVVLDGSGSYDLDYDPIQFTWTAPEGITLDNKNTTRPSFTVPIELADNTILVFTLIVNDGRAVSEQSTVNVLVNKTSTDGTASHSSKLKIYPNPAQDYFMISGIDEKTDVSIFDISGSKVNELEIIPNEKIPTTQLKKGIYFIKVKNFTEKLIIK